MFKQAKVIWSEGMLLRQQHFQQQERYFQFLLNQRCFPVLPDHYGFHRLQVAHSALSLQRFALEQASGVFPDGTAFSLGEEGHNALLSPLTIPPGTREQLIYLCLPLVQDQQAEVVTSSQLPRRYHSEAINLPDTSQEQSLPAPLVIGLLNLQLRLAQDNLSAFTVLPVARILYCDEQQGVVLDTAYIPPVMVCAAAPLLLQEANEIADLLEQRIKTLAMRVANPSSADVANLNEWLLLQTLNRHYTLWRHGASRPSRHPLEFYQQIVELVAELAALTTKEKYWSTFIPYQQHELAQTFIPLLRTLREFLNKAIEHAAFTILLTKSEQGWWLSPVISASIWTQSQLLVAVKADVAPEEVQKRFPSQAKLAAADQIASLIQSQLPGLALEPLTTVPPAIPYYAGFTYFAVKQQDSRWMALAQCGQLAIHVTGQLPNIALHCWATRS